LSSLIAPVESAPSTLRVFMTGASGCIGHYILELLLQSDDYELFLLLRDPTKLQLPIQDNPRVHILPGSLSDIEQFAELLATIDIAILTAAAWGGDQDVMDINVNANLRLMSLLDAERCQQVIYFSTASILDQENQPLPEASKIGTDYIRSKYECHRRLPELAVYNKITTVFPTLVFGGGQDKPASFISAGLQDVTKWIGLIRFFKADGGFHFAHAQDIALVVNYLVEHPSTQGYREFVLGNSPLTADQAVEQACAYLGQPIWFRIPLSFFLADVLIKVFRIEMAPWDYFCVQYRHFVYADAVNPTSFGLDSYCPTMADLLRVHGIKGRS
jgi:nucleoside-diphosphate-sugar epimerase